MRTPLRAWPLSALALLLVVTGCFRLSRKTPPVQYYVLSGTAAPNATRDATTSAPTAATPPTASGGLSLGLRRLDLASYLAVPSIITRRGTNEIAVSEFHRWGEDLSEAINRVVAAHLVNGQLVRAVDVAPWATRTRHDFVVQLHVTRFEGVAPLGAGDGRSHLLADWDIVRPLDGRVLVRGRTEAFDGAWRVGDYAGLVTGLDAALGRLARDVSDCLARFPNDSTPPARCGSEVGARGERQERLSP